MSGATTEELFRSPDLLVRRTGWFSSPCCVVTFDSFTDNRTLDRRGFGEEFFQSREIDAIHVLSRENDWYQYPEMEHAMAAVHAATRSYGRVLTYGSSMGGYAAIRLAGLAGAHCALAMSPQYSIDPKVAAFERRSPEPSKRFKPVWERRLPFPVLDEAYVLYDPKDVDGRHAALLQTSFKSTPVPLMQAGHTVVGYLHEVGLLQSTVLAACHGVLDVPDLIHQAWDRRGQSPQHLLAIAQQTPEPSRRIALLQEAVQIAPDHGGCLSSLALPLPGRFVEALAIHRHAVDLHPTSPGVLVLYSFALEQSGDLPAALTIMEHVAALTSGASLYAKRLRRLRVANRVRRNTPPWLLSVHGWVRRRRRRAMRAMRLRP